MMAPKQTLPAAPSTKLAAVLATTHDAVFGSTRLGVINSWNPAATALYGYTAEEMIGRHRNQLIAPERRVEEEAILERVTRGEPVEQYHTTRVCKNGSVVSVSLTISATVDETDPSAVVGAVMVSRRVGAPPDAAGLVAGLVQRGRRRTQRPGRRRPGRTRCAVAAGAANGGARTARRRRGPRLQQPSRRDP